MILGLDSKKIVRYGKGGKNFIVIMGVGVCVNDEAVFKEKYAKAMNSLFEKRGLVSRFPIYKSSTLKSLGLDFDFFEEFYKLIKEDILKIHVFLTILRSSTRVTVFPKSSKSEISSIDFMTKHVDSGYPHICAWSLLQKWNGEVEYCGEILLDDFSANKTNAWNTISSYQNLHIFPNGDKVNSLISTADILINYIDNKLLSENKKIGADQISECLSDFGGEADIRFIGEKCLWNMVPLRSGDTIKTSTKAKHPIFFILQGTGKSKLDKKVVEFSPLFRKIIASCYERGGCCKFLDPRMDIDSITNEDFIIPVGAEAKVVVDQLSELGYSFKAFEEM